MDERERRRGYEKSEINFSGIKKSVIALLVVAVVLYLGMWVLYRYWRGVDTRRDVSRSLVDVPAPVPPEPRLQVDPKAEFQEYFRKQQEVLKTYAWVSRADGKVRIPIDRAMELVAEREKRR